jgi:pimeloyl-ACP methyl ester carboxylesterase
MAPLSSRTLRYAHAWATGPRRFVEDEVVLDRDGVEVPATIVRPEGAPDATPSWVVLHGITRPGRAHAQLVRFTRAVASAGVVTIVPEVPEWRELRLSPHLTVPTIAAGLTGLEDAGLNRGEPVGVVGFSFGAPHAIAASAAEGLQDRIAGAVGFGGYARLESAFAFMMSGRHEWKGRAFGLRPDPYGRWIVAANYLTQSRGYERAGDVARALGRLAERAGDVGAASWDPVYDTFISEMRASVDPERRSLFDVFARRSDDPGRLSEEAPHPGELAEALAEAARRVDPAIDPTDALARVECHVELLHGRNDHLIPFTEAYRLRDALPRAAARLTVTRLFGHSAQDPFPYARAFREVPAFAGALDRILTLI